MKAVIYARYSSANQTEESIEGQLRVCKEYATRQQISIIGSYIDRATTGTNDNRPDFQRMIKDSAKGDFDTVIVYKFDRFARDRYDSANYKRRLKQNGVKLLSAQENIPDSPEGIILESMLEGMAEYFSAELSQKVKRGKYERALKNQFHGSTVPLGYKIDQNKQYIIDEETAPIVRKIFNMYTEGHTVANICREVNGLGYKTPQQKPFNLGFIRYMIRNNVYIGTYKCGNVVTENAFKGIITKSVYEKANQRMDNNKHRPGIGRAKEKYFLSGRVFCGHCGSPIIADSTTSTNGTHHQYYKCKGRIKKNGCKKATSKKPELEELVYNMTINTLSDPETQKAIAKECIAISQRERTDNNDLNIYKANLQEVQKEKENILKALSLGIYAGGVQEKLLELDDKERTILNAIDKLNTLQPDLTEDHILFMLEQLQKQEDIPVTDYKARILEGCVSAVQLFDDRIIVYLNVLENGQNVNKSVYSDIENNTPPLFEQSCIVGGAKGVCHFF